MLKENIPLLTAGACLHWLAPRGKNPVTENWSNVPPATEGQLRDTYRSGYNIGLRPGAWSKTPWGYLHAIDLDIRRPEMAKEAWDALLAMIPSARRLPSVISGSGGESRHLYFLAAKPYASAKLARSNGFDMVWDEKKGREVKKFHWEIDLGGTGKNMVLPPSVHPETGDLYRWEREIDFEFPSLLSVPCSTLDALGARTKTASGDEDHDLEAAFAQTPKEFSDDDIWEFLDNLPEDWVEDRSSWILVGLALHHQYGGSDKGFSIWCDWSEQSEKFDEAYAAYRWRTFKTRQSTNPVTILTVRRAALDNKVLTELSLECDDEDGFSEPSASASRSTALSFLDDEPPKTTGTSVTLLDSDERPPAIVSPELPAPHAINENPPHGWQTRLHRNEEGQIRSTLANIRLIVTNDIRTFRVPAYNEFTQEIVVRKTPAKARKIRDTSHDVINLTGSIWENPNPINGALWTDTHDNALRAMIEAPTTQGGYGIKVSDRDLRAAVDIAAQENHFHPIRDMLSALKWDGVPRLDRLFVDYLGAEDNEYHRESARLMCTGAVTRVFEPGHKFDFVVILEGAQGLGKSSFIRTLALHWFNELTGDPGDTKGMVELMQGSWILEMGELASMGRAEVNDMKAFVTRQVDKVRLSYDRRAREYPRQCIFMGSTNEKEYLRDTSGGRRWWPIQCNLKGMIDNHRLAREVLQIWAEAVSHYRTLRQTHPFGELPLSFTDQQAEAYAKMIQESRRVETPEEILSGQIQQWLDTPIGDEFDDLDGVKGALRTETCIPQIWHEMMGKRATESIPQAEATRIGRAMALLDGWKRTENRVQTHPINKRYGKCRVYTRIA